MQQRVVHLLITLLVFLYIVFEELVWETIARPVYDYIHALKILQKIEAKIHRFPPWLLLIAFLLIFVSVELVGLLSGALLIQGHVVTAIMLYAVKIPIAAFAFWLFRVSQDKLLQIGWFARAYHWLMAKIDALKATEIYRTIKTKTARLKAKIRMLKARWLPKGDLKKRIKRVYIQLKKIIRKDSIS